MTPAASPWDIVELSRKVNEAALLRKKLTLTVEQLLLLVSIGLTELIGTAATSALKEHVTWQVQNGQSTSEENSGSTTNVVRMGNPSRPTSTSSGMRPVSGKLDARARAQAMFS